MADCVHILQHLASIICGEANLRSQSYGAQHIMCVQYLYDCLSASVYLSVFSMIQFQDNQRQSQFKEWS